MHSGKKRSGFQITSVTSDLNQSPASQSSPSVLLTTFQSEASSSFSRQGSSSQPTSPSLKRKYVSHDAPGQGAGSSSRFRVVRLAVGGSGGRGRGESYRRGRWMCMDFIERQEGMGFRRVMDSMRHAHSLESLEMIGQDKDRGGFFSSRIRGDTAHLLTLPIKDRQGAGPVVHSGPPSPTHQQPINIQLLDHREEKKAPLSPRQRHVPPPVRLDAAGQTPAPFSLDQAIFSLPGHTSTSSSSLIAIDNKIEQAMDLVKSHLMLAVREEVELLKEQIKDLQEKNQQLERENHILRALTHNMRST